MSLLPHSGRSTFFLQAESSEWSFGRHGELSELEVGIADFSLEMDLVVAGINVVPLAAHLDALI
jgi:hypothetical protein